MTRDQFRKAREIKRELDRLESALHTVEYMSPDNALKGVIKPETFEDFRKKCLSDIVEKRIDLWKQFEAI